MAVVDFRAGGFVGAQPRQVRDYPYGQDPHGQDPRYDADAEDWQSDPQWDEQRYYTNADEGLLAQSGSVIGRVGRFTQYLGALISVGLMVMLLVWGYKLVVRDVSGVPVIRAIEGEARSAPDNPGGELSAHTGLAVNSVAAGADTRPTNQVAIAPESTSLGEEDVAMGNLGATARAPSRDVDLPVNETSARVIARPDAEAAAAEAAAKAAAALEADRLAALADTPTAPVSETPANEAVTDLEGEAANTDAINVALTEAAAAAAPPPAAVKISARPAPRPRRAAPAPTEAATPVPAAVTQTAAAAPAPAPKVAPSAISSGAAMVQIGAFDSNALADGEWGRVSRKFGALFAGKAQVIQKAESGGRTFWRLRAAGFESRDEARRFCAALIAEGIDCIPATAK